MCEVHKPNGVNSKVIGNLKGREITSERKIIYKENSGVVIKNAVNDLQDYFKVSMNLDLDIFFGNEALF